MNIAHPRLQALYGFWQTKASGERLPPRSAFLAEEFRPWMGHIAIADVEPDPLRFKFSLFGTVFVYVNNSDMTGRYVDEAMPEPIRAAILDDYTRCTESAAPLYVHRQSVNREWTSIHRLLLPCAENGDRVDKIIVGLYTEGGRTEFISDLP